MRRVRALLAILVVGTILAAPVTAGAATVTPASGPDHRPGRHGSWWQGLPLKVEPLPAQVRLAGAGPAWRLHYLSTSWKGRSAVVTGALTLPAGRPPAGGWPVVSAGHGSVGVADQCAPSLTGPSPWERMLYEQLLAAGYAVAATDYEGIGSPGDAPFLAGTSQAYQMIDLVRAARRVAPVSRSWAGVGYSQGGHAALFTEALAGSYAPELRHRGTVALAPVTRWRALFGFPGGDAPETPANLYLPYLGYGFAITHPDRFVPADHYTAAGLALVKLARDGCLDEMVAAIDGMTNGEVLRDPVATLALMTELIAPQEVPVAPYPRPVRLAHGTGDDLPWQLTELTASQLAGAGTDVVFTPVPDLGHLDLLPAVAPQVIGWLGEFEQ